MRRTAPTGPDVQRGSCPPLGQEACWRAALDASPMSADCAYEVHQSLTDTIPGQEPLDELRDPVRGVPHETLDGAPRFVPTALALACLLPLSVPKDEAFDAPRRQPQLLVKRSARTAILCSLDHAC